MSYFLLTLFLAQEVSLRFRDVAEEAGVARELTYGGVGEKRYILETTGTGAAFLDYDEDSDMDLFVVDGRRLGGVPEGAGNRLYRNVGEGRFVEVTEAAGLSLKAHQGWGQGAAFSDVDNDGDPDLLVTYYGAALLYRNRGDGTFVECGEASGLAQAGWHTSAAFADYDADGFDDSLHCALRRLRPIGHSRTRRRTQLLFHGDRRHVRAQGPSPGEERPLSQPRGLHLRRRERESGSRGESGVRSRRGLERPR